MIRKTTILFLALALLATLVRGEDVQTAGDAGVEQPKGPPAGTSDQDTKTVAPPKGTITEAPSAETPAESGSDSAGAQDTAPATDAPAEGGNGTSSSAFMSYGLGASVVLLAAL